MQKKIVRRKITIMERLEEFTPGFLAGFLGWFILANMIFTAIAWLMISIPSIENGFVLLIIGVWVPTAITLIILFRMKKGSIGNGILAASILNIIISVTPILSMAIGQRNGLFYILQMALLPFPSAGIFYLAAVMDMISPPYTNFGHLLDFYSLK